MGGPYSGRHDDYADASSRLSLLRHRRWAAYVRRRRDSVRCLRILFASGVRGFESAGIRAVGGPSLDGAHVAASRRPGWHLSLLALRYSYLLRRWHLVWDRASAPLLY